MGKNENLPITIEEHTSFIKKILKKIFSKKTKESPIDKLVNKMNNSLMQNSDTNEFALIEREVIYDFFIQEIPNGPTKYNNLEQFCYPNGYEQTVTFTNLEGKKESFVLSRQEPFADEIIIGEKCIRLWKPSDLTRSGRDLFGDIINLLKYNQFINSSEDARIFVNEVGNIIKRISEGYDIEQFNHIDNAFKAGEKINKELNQNFLYIEMRNDFDEVYGEYIESYVRVKEAEEKRKQEEELRKEFAEELKFKGIIEQAYKDNRHCYKKKEDRTR